MTTETERNQGRRATLGTIVLLATIVPIGGGLAAWKYSAAQAAAEPAASEPEPKEVVTEAVAKPHEYRATTTSIGTVRAMRSVTVRNELSGTVRSVRLMPGRIVEAGAVLVALDVSVEEAELRALEARARLAERTLARTKRMAERQAVSEMDLDNVRAERDVAVAEIERIRAVIERKTIRAPFRARVGIADVHPGQVLEAGTHLTTLQGVSDAVHVDFAVSQGVAAGLRAGDQAEVFASEGGTPSRARIVAVDSRVDPSTRNATVRARIDDGARFAPGASVRVRVPIGASRTAVVVPVTAVRKGPAGGHVYVIDGAEDQARAHVRRVEAGAVLDVGDEIVILDGLEAGERVAVSRSFELGDGALVSVVDEAQADARAER